MTVETAKVQGRRQLHFSSLDEVVADAEKLVASPGTKMLGNWPLEQLLMHLATAIDHSIDGIAVRAPWFIRLVAPLLKNRFLNKTMSAGFKLLRKAEAGFFPPAGSPQQALDKLRRAAARTGHEKMTARHPALGALTDDEWRRLHLRHAELHLSFAVPG